MTSAVAQFATPAEQALEDTERLVDLLDHISGIDQRLAALEKSLVEAAGADPPAEILSRLDAFENRLDRLELRQRRPVPLAVIQNHRLDPAEREVFLEIQGLFHKLDRDLKQHVTTLDGRLSHYASQFRKIRERLTAVERKGA